jgi:hypothetical protein
VAASDAPAPGEAPPRSEPLGLDAARVDVDVSRDIGYCIVCDAFVERGRHGECPAGHAPRAISGSMRLAPGEELPRLPMFNLAAFLIPPLWGLWYGQWIGVLFVPMYIFANNALELSLGKGGPWLAITIAIFAATLLFQWFFARRANGLAWRHVCAKQSVETFRRRQRVWAGVAVAIWVAVGAWIAAYASGVRI